MVRVFSLLYPPSSIFEPNVSSLTPPPPTHTHTPKLVNHMIQFEWLPLLSLLSPSLSLSLSLYIYIYIYIYPHRPWNQGKWNLSIQISTWWNLFTAFTFEYRIKILCMVANYFTSERTVQRSLEQLWGGKTINPFTQKACWFKGWGWEWGERERGERERERRQKKERREREI